MSRSVLPRFAGTPRLQTLSLATRAAPRTMRLQTSFQPKIFRLSTGSRVHKRTFSLGRPAQKGLSPETENPQPKEAETNDTESIKGAAEITGDEFHELSDSYLDSLIGKLEQLQEAREDVDCEYSAGVLSLTFPPNGTYIINKQPPNKQIWLSSPLSGPKRYDWVMDSEGQDAKEGTGKGDWVYLRDGTALGDVLKKELNVDMSLWVPDVPVEG